MFRLWDCGVFKTTVNREFDVAFVDGLGFV